MERTVIVKIKVDPSEYHDAKDTVKGAIELVEAILRSEADFPPGEVSIECETVFKKVSIDG